MNYIEECNSYTVVEPSPLFCKKCYDDINCIGNKSVNYRVINDCFGSDLLDEFDCKYDFIVISGLLHEIPDPVDIISAAMNLLEDSGVLHINVPNANSIHRLIAMHAGLIKDVHELSSANFKLQQQKVYDIELLKSDIDQAAKLCNFRIEFISEGGILMKPFTHRQMEQILEMGIIDKTVMQGLKRMADAFPELASEIFVNIKKRG